MEAETVQREWFTYNEASAYTGLGKTKLWELHKSGAVKTAKVGKSVRFSRRDLSRFMEESCYE